MLKNVSRMARHWSKATPAPLGFALPAKDLSSSEWRIRFLGGSGSEALSGPLGFALEVTSRLLLALSVSAGFLVVEFFGGPVFGAGLVFLHGFLLGPGFLAGVSFSAVLGLGEGVSI